MTVKQSAQRVSKMVSAIRRVWAFREAIRLAAFGVAGVFLWLLTMVVLDNLVILSTGHFMTGWGLAFAAGAAWMCFAAFRLKIRPPSEDGFARMYEARTPNFRNRLINSVQYLSSGMAEREMMASAALIENAEHLNPSTAVKAIDRQPMLRALQIRPLQGWLLQVCSGLTL